MPSYVLGPAAGTGVGTYWDVEARTRQDQVVPMSLEPPHHHQPLDHVAIATASSASLASHQQRQQVVALSCVERQSNCTTPRESPNVYFNCNYLHAVLTYSQKSSK